MKVLEIKKMSDRELAQRAVNYIVRLEKLMDEVGEILGGRGCVEPYAIDAIHGTYKQLKEEIRADGHYVGLVQNEDRRNGLYSAFFSPSVREAAAFGFTSPTNGRIDQRFFSSIEEAHYKMIKYNSLAAWRKIAQS